ncbi:MAG: chitobiase/beta-hexosaminidase C-terminal domain-containing protein, partial [Lachnospiraceae bacterium]|nr:chitobiase/beta-hexosaminidase C-terminal domain-containing protein [Lachnospiraceae bacterium]
DPDPSPEPPVPRVPVTVIVNLMDLNSHQDAADPRILYTESGARITLVAPDVDGEQFTRWDLKEHLEIDQHYDTTDRTIIAMVPEEEEETTIEIEVQYTPVVKQIDLTLKAPVTDEEMQMSAIDEAGSETMKVTISDQYVIHPDHVKVEWSPEPLDGEDGKKIADQNTEYTVTMSLVPGEDADGSYIRAKKADGGEYVKMAGIFAISPSIAIKLNGESALLNPDDMRVSFTFPATERTKFNLVSVTTPDNITGLPHGTSREEIEELLPETVKLLVDTGMELDGDVTWELDHEEHIQDPRNAVVWTAQGKVTLPNNVENPYDVSTEPLFFIQVNEADHAAAPFATLPTGVYVADQVTFLETMQEGGTTYYTTDGSDPKTYGREYQGEEILICRNDPNQELVNETFFGEDEHGNLQAYETGRKMFVLNAYTVKDGLWDSPVMTYTYVFDNAIPVPAGETYEFNGEEQTLLLTDEFFTVVGGDALPDGCRLNENGDPVAKDAGSYELTLRINDGYVWVIETVLEDGTVEREGTTEDQIVTFTVESAELENAYIQILTSPVRLDEDEHAATPEIRVFLNDTGDEPDVAKALDPSDYDVKYEDNTEPGEGKVWVEGKNNCTGISDKFPFGIYEDDAYGFSFDPIPDQTYTGKAIRPPVKVYYEGHLLTEKKDYTITFKNNIKAHDLAEFTVRGRGNYGGMERSNFTILPRDLIDDDLVISEIAPMQYNSKNPKPYKPVPKLTYNRMALKKDRDFTVTYYTDEACTEKIDAPLDIGRYFVKLEGVEGSNYTGTAYLEFEITDPGLKHVAKLSVKKIPNQPFTGNPIELDDLGLVVKDGSKKLILGEDYEADCFGQNPGEGMVVITGNEDRGYTGRRIVGFTITGFPLSKVSISGFESAVDYNGGQEVKQNTLKLTYRKDRKEDPVDLHEGEDYTITYSGNRDAGIATMTITGIEDKGYKGTVKKTFRIRPWSLKADNIEISVDGTSYEKGGAKPKPVVKATFDGLDSLILEENKDYKLSYANNKAIHSDTGNKAPTVIIKGMGNYKDTDRSKTFAITEIDMSDAGVRVIAKDLEANGKKGKWKSAVTVVDKAGNKLVAGKDYDKNTIQYSYNEDGSDPVPADAVVDPGEVIYVTVSATGSPYKGSAQGQYRILEKGYDISKLKATVVLDNPKLYTSREVMITEDEIVWTRAGKPVDVDFVIEDYKSNINKGSAKVTVRGTDPWGGQKVITFSIGARGFLWWFRL